MASYATDGGRGAHLLQRCICDGCELEGMVKRHRLACLRLHGVACRLSRLKGRLKLHGQRCHRLRACRIRNLGMKKKWKSVIPLRTENRRARLVCDRSTTAECRLISIRSLAVHTAISFCESQALSTANAAHLHRDGEARLCWGLLSRCGCHLAGPSANFSHCQFGSLQPRAMVPCAVSGVSLLREECDALMRSCAARLRLKHRMGGTSADVQTEKGPLPLSLPLPALARSLDS